MSRSFLINTKLIQTKDVEQHLKSISDVPSIYSSKLIIEEERIEIELLFSTPLKTELFSMLLSLAESSKLLSCLNITLDISEINKGLKRIDLSDSRVINYPVFMDQKELKLVLSLDKIKLYWNAIEQKINTSDLYLNNNGFKLVASHYSYLTHKSLGVHDGNFNIGRMSDSVNYCYLENSTFSPCFEFVTKDNKEEKIAIITKKPKIRFEYLSDVSEKNAILYNDMILTLASFYYHKKIDYLHNIIHLKENTIELLKVEQNKSSDSPDGLYSFRIDWSFNKFMQSNWQKDTLKNYSILSKAVELFNQALLVDSSSEFLIRYNIIEICNKYIDKNIMWNFTLVPDQLGIYFEDIKLSISNIIDVKEKEDFNKRWNDIIKQIKIKPSRKQFLDALSKNNIDFNSLPINKLIKLRNSITHGSIKKAKYKELEKANELLYRINGIMILNLIGINDWKLNTVIH